MQATNSPSNEARIIIWPKAYYNIMRQYNNNKNKNNNNEYIYIAYNKQSSDARVGVLA